MYDSAFTYTHTLYKIIYVMCIITKAQRKRLSAHIIYPRNLTIFRLFIHFRSTTSFKSRHYIENVLLNSYLLNIDVERNGNSSLLLNTEFKMTLKRNRLQTEINWSKPFMLWPKVDKVSKYEESLPDILSITAPQTTRIGNSL